MKTVLFKNLYDNSQASQLRPSPWSWNSTCFHIAPPLQALSQSSYASCSLVYPLKPPRILHILTVPGHKLFMDHIGRAGLECMSNSLFADAYGREIMSRSFSLYKVCCGNSEGGIKIRLILDVKRDDRPTCRPPMHS